MINIEIAIRSNLNVQFSTAWGIYRINREIGNEPTNKLVEEYGVLQVDAVCPIPPAVSTTIKTLENFGTPIVVCKKHLIKAIEFDKLAPADCQVQLNTSLSPLQLMQLFDQWSIG
jgi:hypothetical protein